MTTERKWGPKSAAVRETLDPRLKNVVDFILVTIADISLLHGARGEEEQNEYFANGTSKVRWPHSKHNKIPLSYAVDLQPYPMPNSHAHDPARKAKAEKKLWASLAYIAGAARVYAFAIGVRLIWGGDWDMDDDLTDQTFDDLFHLELDFNKEDS